MTDFLKKNSKSAGVTLIELIIATIISAIVITALAVLFTSELNFRESLHDRIAVHREARIAMEDMEKILRFAKRSTVIPAVDTITADIAGGHLMFIPADTTITYTRAVGDLKYTQGADPAVIIAKNITALNFSWEDAPSNTRIKITLTARFGKSSVDLESTVRLIGE